MNTKYSFAPQLFQALPKPKTNKQKNSYDIWGSQFLN